MKRYLIIALRKSSYCAEAGAAHRVFIDDLRAQGRIEMTGGFSDASGGAYLLQAASLEEANAIVQSDPLVRHDASTVTLYEWNTR
ncbi:MAG: YciI family protein [Xanthomonadaceae bacterium]|jgi:uncharacterized protein YciI|nr:YciI family protein [Xanthomonadaceae bacterium]